LIYQWLRKEQPKQTKTIFSSFQFLIMKRIKSILPAMALVFGMVMAFAFTTPNTMKDPVTYYFQGGAMDDVDNPNNYSTTPPTGVNCGSGTIVCSILAEPDGNDPAKPLFDVEHTVSEDPTFYDVTNRLE
jgi:hypothetical protein